MRIVKLLLLLTLTAGCESDTVAQSQQGFGSGEGLPRNEIYHVTGDLYRFRDVRHFGMFLVTSEGIIIVDPTSEQAATWLKGELDERFDVPVRWVIYSHSHYDHASGGELFADTAKFIGHENMRARLAGPAADAPLPPRDALWDADNDGAISEAEAQGTALAGNFARADQNGDGRLSTREIWARQHVGIRQVPPDIYYSDQATITLGGKTVELHYTGRNHSDDMTVIRFPDERVIYTVDFLTPKRPPRTTLYGGYMPDWLDSLRQVEQLDFDILSPGHELPGTKADVIEQRQYMEDLIERVSAGIDQGLSKDEIVETVLMEDYDHLIEYDISRAGNVAGTYEILMSTR